MLNEPTNEPRAEIPEILPVFTEIPIAEAGDPLALGEIRVIEVTRNPFTVLTESAGSITRLYEDLPARQYIRDPFGSGNLAAEIFSARKARPGFFRSLLARFRK